MAKRYIPEQAELLRRVEEKFGRRLATTTDYELLSFVIEHETGDLISSSTLKRLWGYVRYASLPRIATLDTLSRYIGFRDFKSYCTELARSATIVSSFFSAKSLETSVLHPGAEVTIGWAPDRLVTLRFLGGMTFEITSAKHTKLVVGDRFECSGFILGAPLYIASIHRTDGTQTTPYVAGKVEGLNILEWEDA